MNPADRTRSAPAAATAPPIRRAPMPAQPWFGAVARPAVRAVAGLHFPTPSAARRAVAGAPRARRRRVLLALVALLAAVALLLQWQRRAGRA